MVFLEFIGKGIQKEQKMAFEAGYPEFTFRDTDTFE